MTTPVERRTKHTTQICGTEKAGTVCRLGLQEYTIGYLAQVKNQADQEEIARHLGNALIVKDRTRHPSSITLPAGKIHRCQVKGRAPSFILFLNEHNFFAR